MDSANIEAIANPEKVYDGLATVYDHWIEEVPALKIFYNIFHRTIGQNKEKFYGTVLDIGCGMGHFLYYLSKKGYKNIKGIDICQEQVDAAKKIVPGDIRQIPDLKSYFAESGETFDMITMNDVLEHLDKKEILETLKMVRTSLNPSGIFICRDWQSDRAFSFSCSLQGIYDQICW